MQPQSAKKADNIYKDLIPTYVNYFHLQIANEDSARILNKILIKKFKSIFEADSTYLNIPAYLGDCYVYENNFIEAIYWYKKETLISSTVYKPCYSCIGLSYVQLGELDSCKKYIQKELKESDKEDNFSIQRTYLITLKSLADSIYYQKYPDLIKTLKSKNISACHYSNEVLKFLIPLKNQEYFKVPFNEDTLTFRQKNYW